MGAVGNYGAVGNATWQIKGSQSSGDLNEPFGPTVGIGDGNSDLWRNRTTVIDKVSRLQQRPDNGRDNVVDFGCSRPVEHDSERTFIVVLKHHDHGAIEVAVIQHWSRYQKLALCRLIHGEWSAEVFGDVVEALGEGANVFGFDCWEQADAYLVAPQFAVALGIDDSVAPQNL